MWQRKQYEDAALKIAKDFAVTEDALSINDLAVKVARDNNLDSEGIRTMVRLANVSAFQELFAKKANDGDRMVEYELGDPELVINKLYGEAQEKVAEATAVMDNYDRSLDYFGPFSKVAADVDEGVSKDTDVPESTEPIVDKKQVKALFQDAKRKMEGEEKEAQACWSRNMENAAQTMRVIGVETTFNKLAFEKDAICTLGESIVPELKALNLYTQGDMHLPIAGGLKVADVKDLHVVIPNRQYTDILHLLKEAQTARYDYKKWAKGIELVVSQGEL